MSKIFDFVCNETKLDKFIILTNSVDNKKCKYYDWNHTLLLNDMLPDRNHIEHGAPLIQGDKQFLF